MLDLLPSKPLISSYFVSICRPFYIISCITLESVALFKKSIKVIYLQYAIRNLLFVFESEYKSISEEKEYISISKLNYNLIECYVVLP